MGFEEFKACEGCPDGGCSVEKVHEQIEALDKLIHEYREAILGHVCEAEKKCSHGDCDHEHSSAEHMEGHLSELIEHEKTCDDADCKQLHKQFRVKIAEYLHKHNICHTRAHAQLKAIDEVGDMSEDDLLSLLD